MLREYLKTDVSTEHIIKFAFSMARHHVFWDHFTKLQSPVVIKGRNHSSPFEPYVNELSKAIEFSRRRCRFPQYSAPGTAASTYGCSGVAIPSAVGRRECDSTVWDGRYVSRKILLSSYIRASVMKFWFLGLNLKFVMLFWRYTIKNILLR